MDAKSILVRFQGQNKFNASLSAYLCQLARKRRGLKLNFSYVKRSVSMWFTVTNYTGQKLDVIKGKYAKKTNKQTNTKTKQTKQKKTVVGSHGTPQVL